jgi:N-acetylglucosaminyldiphosphoundecaprenol N-acetyl-beta-D-mannosaminyltransferase
LTAGSISKDDRVDILGVNASAISMEDAVAVIQHWIASRVPNYVCVTGVHGIIESLGNSRLQPIHNEAGLVTPDGMPLVWMARSLGFNRTRRV